MTIPSFYNRQEKPKPRYIEVDGVLVKRKRKNGTARISGNGRRLQCTATRMSG